MSPAAAAVAVAANDDGGGVDTKLVVKHCYLDRRCCS